MDDKLRAKILVNIDKLAELLYNDYSLLKLFNGVNGHPISVGQHRISEHEILELLSSWKTYFITTNMKIFRQPPEHRFEYSEADILKALNKMWAIIQRDKRIP